MSKNLKILLIGQLISMFGGNLQKFVFSLFILEKTGSAITFSLALSLSIIPTLLLTPISGYFADKFDKKKMIVILDSISFIILSIFLVSLTNTENTTYVIYLIFAAIILLSIVTSFMIPVVQSAIPRIVDKEELFKANGLSAVINGLSNILAPIIGGGLYAFVGFKIIIAVIIIIFVFAIVIECLLKFNSKGENDIHNNFVDEFKGLLIYVKKNDYLVKMVKIAIAVNFILAPFFIVALPIITIKSLNLEGMYLGIAQGAIAFAMLLAGGLSHKLLKDKKIFEEIPKELGKISILFFILFLCSFLNLKDIILNNIIYYIILISICGISMFKMTIISIFMITYIQKRVEDKLLGKVMAFINVISMIFIPLGQIIYGVLFDKYFNMMSYIILFTGILLLIVSIFYRKYNITEND